MFEVVKSVREPQLLWKRKYCLPKEKKKVSNSKRCSHLTRICAVFVETQQEIVFNTWQAVCSTSHIEQEN